MQHWFIPLFFAAMAVAAPAMPQERNVPYWATMRADEVNMRVGPSADYKIEWVYQRRGLPVRVVRLREGWRLIQDADGAQGWVVARLLTPERGALVVGDKLAEMRSEPGGRGTLKWKLEPGVVGRLGRCEVGWCELNVAGHRGWVDAKLLWGAGDP